MDANTILALAKVSATTEIANKPVLFKTLDV